MYPYLCFIHLKCVCGGAICFIFSTGTVWYKVADKLGPKACSVLLFNISENNTFQKWQREKIGNWSCLSFAIAPSRLTMQLPEITITSHCVSPSSQVCVVGCSEVVVGGSGPEKINIITILKDYHWNFEAFLFSTQLWHISIGLQYGNDEATNDHAHNLAVAGTPRQHLLRPPTQRWSGRRWRQSRALPWCAPPRTWSAAQKSWVAFLKSINVFSSNLICTTWKSSSLSNQTCKIWSEDL